MNEWGASGLHCKVTLKDILESSGQPISEEQAWALCYQCSCKLKQMMLGFEQLPAVRGIDDIYIHQDGAVSFAPSTDTQVSSHLEKKMTERLGKAVYMALDWGLSNEIERVLSDSLDNLLYSMLGLDSDSSDPTIGSWPPCTLNYIIKECVERLFVPSEASAHYRAVCRIQFAEHKDICSVLQTIERSKQSLEKINPDEDPATALVMCENWGSLWSSLMNELRLGIRLRCAKERSYTALPIEYVLTPYELLMNDIRSKRCNLRQVEDIVCSSVMHELHLGIHRCCTRERSYTTLPVEYTLTPHELLMNDIRSKRRTLRQVETFKTSSPKEDLKEDSVIVEELGTVWSDVMNELSLGIRLRSAKERSYTALPVEYELTPYERLMNDIRSKRYTLRPVEECDLNTSRQSEENAMLDLLRSLKPVSERKLKERSQEEPSLHELLMSEIKTSKTLRSTLDVKRSLMQDEEFKISTNLCSLNRDYTLHVCRMANRWSQLPAIDLLDNGSDGRVSWPSEIGYESSSEHKVSDLTSSSTDLSFFPVLTSSQVDLRMNGIMNHEKVMSGHKRSSSYEGSFQGSGCRQSWRTPRIRLPPTISELVPVRRTMLKTEMLVFTSSKDFPGYKACSSCLRKRLFFSWPYSCKFCDRTICPECHVEMMMPFKQCMHLPVSFFKALVLTRDSDPVCQAQKYRIFCREALNWDHPSVPLVFEPKDIAEEFSFHERLMHNWTRMDICVKCEEYILSVINVRPQSEFPGNALKSRSISESSAMFRRH